MAPAQRSFLITMEMRRDGLQSIADRIRTALSSDAEAADQAIEEIAGAMSAVPQLRRDLHRRASAR